MDMGVHEAVVRASELLKRAQEERAKSCHAASNATTSIYKSAPDWLAPLTLDGIGEEYSDKNGDRAEIDLDEVMLCTKSNSLWSLVLHITHYTFDLNATDVSSSNARKKARIEYETTESRA